MDYASNEETTVASHEVILPELPHTSAENDGVFGLQTKPQIKYTVEATYQCKTARILPESLAVICRASHPNKQTFHLQQLANFQPTVVMVDLG